MQVVLKVSLISLFLLFFSAEAVSQVCSGATDIQERVSLRHNGNIDFTIIGETQNPAQNNDVVNVPSICSTFLPITTTTATLDLSPGDNIISAYLYWSSVGPTDKSVFLNGQSINSDRCWSYSAEGPNNDQINVFSSFADVTPLVQSIGEATYTFTGMDNSSTYAANNCSGGNGSLLFGGWALVVIFENTISFGDYSIFVLDGFKGFQNESFTANLQTNVFDDYIDSHVGIVSWEGDDFAFQGDSQDYFRLNGVTLPSDGYTDPFNIFNGTDSFEDPVDNTFYNGDLDDFDASSVVQGLLNTEAANFNFELKTGQDVVIINTLVFRIPNQAPDATITMPDEVFSGCSDNRTFDLEYVYKNEDYASQELPANTPVNFYLGGTTQLVGSSFTQVDLDPGQFATNIVSITLPASVLGEFTIVAKIDDPNSTATNYGTVLELFEENNEFTSEGFIDQNYYDLEIDVDLCDGEVHNLGDGTPVTSDGDFPFDELTVRGQCDSIGVVRVRFHSNYDITLDLETVCEGEPVVLPDKQEVVLEPQDEIYTFTHQLETLYGCDSIVNSSFKVNANQVGSSLIQICAGQEITLPDPDNTLVSETGDYVVVFPNQAKNGCDSILNIRVEALDILYPNAFGPDGNGNNEGFKAILPPICPDLINEYSLKIYNRWGELVFETNDVSFAWDGMFNGEESKQDFYLWYAEYKSTSDKKIVKQGGVTLLR